MTPEVICSVVFGVVATVLTLVGIIQSFLQRPNRVIDIEAQRVWYGQRLPQNQTRLDRLKSGTGTKKIANVLPGRV